MGVIEWDVYMDWRSRLPLLGHAFSVPRSWPNALTGVGTAAPFTRLVDTSLVAVTATPAGTRYQLSESGPAFLLGETLDTSSERIRRRLGAEGFAQQKAEGANLPVDEALAFVAGRLGDSG